MANPDKDDEEEKPLDPAVARVQAKLQRLMLIAGLTLGIGILAVFLGIIYRITAADDKTLVAAGEASPEAIAEAPAVETPKEPVTAASADAAQQEASAGMGIPDESEAAAEPASLPPVAVEPPPHAEAGSVAPGTPAAVLAVEASIPADARLIASTVAGGRIVLTYDHFGGTIVIVVDPDTLQVVGRLDLKPE
jgi:hypothetical protein